jgi:hypothetical protein
MRRKAKFLSLSRKGNPSKTIKKGKDNREKNLSQ